MMKRLLALLLICTLVLSGGGCAGRDSSLYEEGLELAVLMKEMAESQSYLSTLTRDGELIKKLGEAPSPHPEAPRAVYELEIPRDTLEHFLGTEMPAGLSAELRELLLARAYGAVAPTINARGGASYLAASSLCSAGSSFVNRSFRGNALYLYIYKEGAPLLAVFSAGQDGSVSASASYLLNEGLALKNREETEAFFEGYGVKLREIDDR